MTDAFRVICSVSASWLTADERRARRPGLSEWLAQLTTAATCVLRIFPSEPDLPLRAEADYIAWSPQRGLQILGLG